MILAEQAQYGSSQFGNPMPFAEGAYPTTQQQNDFYMTRAPLFERMDSGLAGEQIANELEDRKRLLEEYKNHLSQSERINAETEHRLQQQGQQRMFLEAELSAKERAHMDELKAMAEEMEQWKERFSKLEKYNVQLRDRLKHSHDELMAVLRKKNELQKKAKDEARQQIMEEKQHMEENSQRASRPPSIPAPTTIPAPTNVMKASSSTEAFHATVPLLRPRNVRLVNVGMTLSDFFGL